MDDCEPNLAREALVTIGMPTGDAFYVDGCLVDCDTAFNIFLYQETNEIPGLQRHDFAWDDTCRGKIASDTELVF